MDMALRAQYGGLQLSNPSQLADICYDMSKWISALIVDMIVKSKNDVNAMSKAFEKQREVKCTIRDEIRENGKQRCNEVYDSLPRGTQHLIEFAHEKGE